MEENKKIEFKLKEFYSKIKNKKAFLIVLFGICGIILIFLSELFPEKESVIPQKSKTEIHEDETELESKIEDAVSKINGTGKTDVTITFDSSKEIFYAENFSETNRNSETDKESEIVTIEGENGEETVVIKTNEAKIRGVLVVCEGGKNPLVREKIIEAICALLDISSNKVSVAEMA